MSNWRMFKYAIADKLFSKEMDDAYEMGVYEGASFALFKMNFNVKLQNHLTLTKTEQKGYNKAIEKMEAVREEIIKKTGARDEDTSRNLYNA